MMQLVTGRYPETAKRLHLKRIYKGAKRKKRKITNREIDRVRKNKRHSGSLESHFHAMFIMSHNSCVLAKFPNIHVDFQRYVLQDFLSRVYSIFFQTKPISLRINAFYPTKSENLKKFSLCSFHR